MTTAMAEPFDAQMTDSVGDIDISMYSGIATTDSWLSVEASMGDEAFGTDTATYGYAQEGIEVEMGDDDQPMTEYEMAEEGVAYDGQELQDVEVYDISQAASPRPVEDHSITINAWPEDTELVPIPSADHNTESPHSNATAVLDVGISDIYNTEDTHHPVDASNLHVVVDDVDAAYDANAEVSTEAATMSHEEEPISTAMAPTELSERGLEPPQTSAPSSSDPAGPILVIHTESLSGFDYSQQPEPDHDLADFHQPNNEEHDISPGNGDPHEISEGVYIDPPPAVLLALPPTAQYGECSLFNQPSSSMPQSPSSSAKPATRSELHLLLHERPTLYYEPLSAVFTALRQEHIIRNLPGFQEAELVLDAYDLQLSISEDNVYTHEVTLHELNVIHDGSDLNGPLRLRLKVFSPRFLTRYTKLRDQVARLNITGDGDAEASAVRPQSEVHTVTEVEPAESDVERIENETEVQAEEAARLSVDQAAREVAQEITEHTTDDAEYSAATGDDSRASFSRPHQNGEDAIQEQAEADITVKLAVESEVEARREHEEEPGEPRTREEGAGVEAELGTPVVGPAVTTEHQPEEAGAENEENEDTFDADDIHGYPAEEEGGDYVEYEEFPDDEDEFGDAFPEEFGGEARDEADPNTGATEEFTERARAELEDAHEDPVDEAYGVEDLEQRDDIGLTQHAGTDTVEHSNSHEVPEDDFENENKKSTISTVPYQSEHTLNSVADTHPDISHDDTVLVADDGDDLDDNWDTAVFDHALPEGHSEGLSRKSSTTTLASRTSKRAYDELELDDFDDDIAPSSFDAKRPRVQ